MADVLEAMGFPSDWCERALSSASGIETAVDLLLQWQAQGTPQFLPPSFRPSSPPPLSSGVNLQPHAGPSPSRPTLRLQPIPTSDSKVANEPLPSSTAQRSSSSSGPSSLDGPSGLNESSVAESSAPLHARDVSTLSPIVHNLSARGRNAAVLQDPRDRTASTSISCVDDGRSGSGRGAGTSRNAINPESTDAVVPDAFAEERKTRYAAAQRAKQEKEAEKAKIRQQHQEDMAHRRFRHNLMDPTDIGQLGVNHGKQPVSQSRPNGAVTDNAQPTQLQIRCPGNHLIKGSFSAGTTLKEVRAYVERQLQRPPMAHDGQDDFTGFRPGAVPFSGHSSRLSSDRQAERVLLQAARENFEVQTNRILASAKTLRNNAGGADIGDDQPRGAMYFLIPIPRQEYFTESAMESTLAQAQLGPRGTLVVQFRNSDAEQSHSLQGQTNDSAVKVQESKSDAADNKVGGLSRNIEACENSGESRGQEAPESGSDETQAKGVSQPRKVSLSFERGKNGTSNTGRNSLDVDGERVRVRELALQAAAKRMSEAAKIFREGLPLGEGETGGAFPYSPYSFDSLPMQTRVPLAQQSPRTTPVDETILPNVKSAGADAELLNASPHFKERHPESVAPENIPPDRHLDALHRQAMAAAEARLKTSQCQPSLMGCGYEQEPEEAESRVGVEETESVPPRGRARVPLSSRLLSRPEKLQRTSDSLPNASTASCDVFNRSEEQPGSSAKPQSQAAGPSHAGPFEAALERFNAGERDAKGKGQVQDDESSQVATAPSSHQAQAEGQSSLRVRLEDGRVQTLSFPANTLLQSVRDSVVPEGADVSAYGFFIPIPEPHFVEGEDLGATLEEVGLVPRGIVHLLQMSTRGMVRQGRTRAHRRRRYVPDLDDEVYNVVGMFRHLADYPHERQDLTYEELMELEESIGRVHVGVPEEVIAALPTHTVKTKKTEATADGVQNEEDADVCIVCMAGMMDGEEALALPCVHTFHPLCIRRWLEQSTCCPTCKHCLI